MIIGINKSLNYVIIEDIINQIINGKIKPGDKITSVREQAKKHRINPQTVQKAYNLLIEEKVIIPKVGSGNFLTKDQKRLDELKTEFIENEIKKFINVVIKYNIDKELIVKKLEEIK